MLVPNLEKDLLKKVPTINRNKVIILINQFIATLSDSIIYLTIMWYIYEVTNSAVSTALIIAISMITQVLLGPFVGVFVDRIDAKRAMHIGYAIMVSVGILLSFVYVFFNNLFVLFIYITLVAHNLGSMIVTPAKNKLLPNIVGKDNIVKINGYIASSGEIAGLLGKSISGFLLSLIGFLGIILTHSAGFIIASFLLLMVVRIYNSQQEVTSIKESNDNNFIAELKSGFEVLINNKPILKTVILISILNMTTLAGSLIVVLVSDQYSGTASQYGLLNAASAIAGIAIGLIIGKIIKKINASVLFSVSLFIAGIAYTGAGITTNIYIGTLLFMLFAASNITIRVLIDSMLILLVEEKVRGRITIIVGVISVIFIPPFTILGGLLADIIGIGVLFVGSGIWLILWSIFPILDKDVKNLKQLEVSQ